LGFSEPTPVQDQTILPAMKGRDVIGLANTGSGKTGAYLLPLINMIHPRTANYGFWWLRPPANWQFK